MMSGGKRMLVHCCCASCASYVLEHLKKNYELAAFFYNPNIHPEGEYRLRLDEMRKLSRMLEIPLIEGPYSVDEWWRAVESFRHLPERSERCRVCYRMRLEKTAEVARELGADLFTTTLSVSPHKIHRWIKETGDELGMKHGVTFHDEDFKKKDGFKISVELSEKYGFTRQDYCGCLLSLGETMDRRREREKRRRR